MKPSSLEVYVSNGLLHHCLSSHFITLSLRLQVPSGASSAFTNAKMVDLFDAKDESPEMREYQIPDNVDSELAEAVRNYVPGTAEERKLVRKIDLFLMPTLWIMYILNYVDRTNIVSQSFLTHEKILSSSV